MPTDSDLLDTPEARSLLSAGVPAAEVLAGLKQQTAEAAPTLLRRRSSNLGEAPLPAGWEERFDPATGSQVLRRFQHPEPRPIPAASFLFYPLSDSVSESWACYTTFVAELNGTLG